ncbi:50S ribosomal protein L13 [Patescibacteria group bacterium]|nr:50S ribosomal protein L13 [Patescibacteria group bacterium]
MKSKNSNTAPKPHVYRIDAEGKSLGRVASDIAFAVQGKRLVEYSPEKLANVVIVVSNANKIVATGNKLESKFYHKFSGYPGGITTRSMEELFTKDPEQFLLKVVRNMLPKNKLRTRMLKKIQFKK